MVTNVNINLFDGSGNKVGYVKSLTIDSSSDSWKMERFVLVGSKVKVPVEIKTEKVFIDKIVPNEAGGIDIHLLKV